MEHGARSMDKIIYVLGSMFYALINIRISSICYLSIASLYLL